MICIGLGSNVGHRLQNLQNAFCLLKERCLTNAQASIVLETPAILPENAPQNWDLPYLNMLVCGETTLSPQQLLHTLQQIEVEMGRPKEHPFWGPRIIDLDILLFNDIQIATEELTIPHKALNQRSFWLHLLAMMLPKVKNPFTQEPFAHYNPTNVFTNTYSIEPKLVGIVNVTPDSFSDGGKYLKSVDAYQHTLELFQAGASIVELGAQSTRPSSRQISEQEEWSRLEEVLQTLQVKAPHIPLSIDTYYPTVIEKCLRFSNVVWINDVQGRLGNNILQEIAKQSRKLCIMHSLSVPPQKDFIDFNVSPIETLQRWTEKILAKLYACGFNNKDIILDPGIGFGKNMYQNWQLLRTAHALKKYDCEVLIGHSRKSFYAGITNEPASERDVETLATSLQLYQQKIDYLRVHNIALHQRCFTAQNCLMSYHGN